MAKKKSIAKQVEEVAVLVQKYVRLNAADNDGWVSCVTCGIRRQWNDRMQGGHFIGRKWLATKLLEENINCQCSQCNGPLKGNLIQYTIFMIDTHGKDFVEELERLKHESRKYYSAEVKELKAYWTLKIKEEMERLGI